MNYISYSRQLISHETALALGVERSIERYQRTTIVVYDVMGNDVAFLAARLDEADPTLIHLMVKTRPTLDTVILKVQGEYP